MGKLPTFCCAQVALLIIGSSGEVQLSTHNSQRTADIETRLGSPLSAVDCRLL